MQGQACFPMTHQIPVHYMEQKYLPLHKNHKMYTVSVKQPEVKDDLPFRNLQVFS